MRMPFGVGVNWAVWICECVAAEFVTHLGDEYAAVVARVRPVIYDLGVAESEMVHIVLRM